MKNHFIEAELKSSFEEIALKHTNSMGNSPLDKVLKSGNADISKYSGLCIAGKYKFSPYTLKLMLKGRGKPPRETSLPTFIDQAILKSLDKTIRSFLPITNQTRLASIIIQEMKEILPTCTGDMNILRIDIKNYFGTIKHNILHESLQAKKCPSWLLKLIKSAIETPSKEKHLRTPQKNLEGIPQGLSISNYLADLYLEGFDEALKANCIKHYRYVDDILIIYDKKNYTSLYQFLTAQFNNLGLNIHSGEQDSSSADKFFNESIYHEDGFDYLGYHFNISQNAIKVSVKDSSIQKFLNNLIGVITKYRKGGYDSLHLGNKQLAINNCIYDLNEKISGAYKNDKRYGWLWYFREMNDLALLDRIDRIIKRELHKDKRTKSFRVKRLKRAHYEVQFFNKNDAGNFILNYGMTDPELIKKFYGEYDGRIIQATNDNVHIAFNNFVNKRLKKLQLDELRDS